MITDIKLTETGDVDITAGAVTYTESTRQHERDLILAQKGHYKSAPAVGVGAINFINEENPENFLRTVRKELTRDGMNVTKVNFSIGELLIIAAYPEE